MSDRKQALKELIVDRMNLNMEAAEITDDLALFGEGLGLDSIDALDLVVGVFEEFNVEIQESDMHVFENVNTLATFIGEQEAAAA